MIRLSLYTVIFSMLSASFVAADDDARDQKNEKKDPKPVVADTAKKQADKTLPVFDEALSNIELSLRTPEQQTGDGFIYLTERSPIRPITGTGQVQRPTFSSLLGSRGSLRNLGASATDGSSRIGLAFGAGDNPDERGLEIAIESAFLLDTGAIPQSADTYSLQQQFADRVYNVGVSVGYSGFNLDATVIREQSLISGDTEGFGVGFSYTGNRWAARLGLSEYTEGSDLYGIDNEVRNFISLELGATYRLSERWGLLGGIRYSDLQNAALLSKSQFTRSQTIFLGGRFRF